jgi:hypothetical protein
LVGAWFASVHGLILTLALIRVLILGSGDFRGELMCLKLGQLSLLRGRGEGEIDSNTYTHFVGDEE